MKPIDIKKVKIKNLLGLIDVPTYEDILFQIVNFMNDENRLDGEFKSKDAYYKTNLRINSEMTDDLDELVKLGYLEKNKNSSYRIIKHLWESD